MLNMKHMTANGLDHYVELAAVRAKLLGDCLKASNGYYQTKVDE